MPRTNGKSARRKPGIRQHWLSRSRRWRLSGWPRIDLRKYTRGIELAGSPATGGGYLSAARRGPRHWPARPAPGPAGRGRTELPLRWRENRRQPGGVSKDFPVRTGEQRPPAGAVHAEPGFPWWRGPRIGSVSITQSVDTLLPIPVGL